MSTIHYPFWRPVAPLKPQPDVPRGYGVALFWEIMGQRGGTVKTISLREKLVSAIRGGEFAEAYLLALQHDHQREAELPPDPPDPPETPEPPPEPVDEPLTHPDWRTSDQP